MGYTTDFSGSVEISPPLNTSEASYLKDFACSRHMNRTRGPLYACPGTDFGQSDADDVTTYNSPHPDQPGLWCDWTPDPEDPARLIWDGGEKFYDSPKWMQYVIRLLSDPEYIAAHIDEDPRLKDFTCDHVLNGNINAQGEDPDDRWVLVVKDNVVSTTEVQAELNKIEQVRVVLPREDEDLDYDTLYALIATVRAIVS